MCALQAFRACDALVIEHCRERGAGYSACTAAVALITNTVLTVAHVGDSRVAVASRSRSEVERDMVGNFLTIDHKPNQPAEQRRVLEVRRFHSSRTASHATNLTHTVAPSLCVRSAGCTHPFTAAARSISPVVHVCACPRTLRMQAGGQVVYLHNDRPFLRGGDFLERQARGERPMQLNYARAFGGADLKPYGLTVDPDFHQIRLSGRDELVLLGSDGLWDVLSPTLAARRAKACLMTSVDPALELTHAALSMHEMCGTTDNISAIVLQLSPAAAPPKPARSAAGTTAAAAAAAVSAMAASGAAVTAVSVKQLAVSPAPSTSMATPASSYPEMIRRHVTLPPIRSVAA